MVSEWSEEGTGRMEDKRAERDGEEREWDRKKE